LDIFSLLRGWAWINNSALDNPPLTKPERTVKTFPFMAFMISVALTLYIFTVLATEGAAAPLGAWSVDVLLLVLTLYSFKRSFM
jgi:hypothetical protein